MLEFGRLNNKSCAACVWNDSSTFEYGAARRFNRIGERKKRNNIGDDARNEETFMVQADLPLSNIAVCSLDRCPRCSVFPAVRVVAFFPGLASWLPLVSGW